MDTESFIIVFSYFRLFLQVALAKALQKQPPGSTGGRKPMTQALETPCKPAYAIEQDARIAALETQLTEVLKRQQEAVNLPLQREQRLIKALDCEAVRAKDLNSYLGRLVRATDMLPMCKKQIFCSAEVENFGACKNAVAYIAQHLTVASLQALMEEKVDCMAAQSAKTAQQVVLLQALAHGAIDHYQICSLQLASLQVCSCGHLPANMNSTPCNDVSRV